MGTFRAHIISIFGAVVFASFSVAFATTGSPRPPSFQKVFVIVLENSAAESTLRQPYLKSLLRRGAYLNNFFAITHPSQPNYIAMTSGDAYGITGNKPVDLDVKHIGDLLEARNKTWRQYASGFPGNCFVGEARLRYARKHVPFLSYTNVQRDPLRCANIVDASQLDRDIEAGTLANYSLYIPDIDDDGHHTSVGYADNWLRKTFDSKFKDSRFMKDMLVVITFDEDDGAHGNHVYTLLLGDSVRAGARADSRYDFYSLLRTIEDAFELGTLGRQDAKAAPITGIWK
jgi:hypothetical protein